MVDPRSLVRMRSPSGLVSIDVTHSLQQPGGGRGEGGQVVAGGVREMIPTIARAAVAVGVDGIFMEARATHIGEPLPS